VSIQHKRLVERRAGVVAGHVHALDHLAIRGAEALAQDEGLRREAPERLARLATDPDSDLDREALLNVRQTAWRT